MNENEQDKNEKAEKEKAEKESRLLARLADRWKQLEADKPEGAPDGRERKG